MITTLASDILVVDTNVVSYIFKRDTRSALYRPFVEGAFAVIAAQTLAELEALPLMNGWSAKRHTLLRDYLKQFFFAEVDENICLRWAEVRTHGKKMGRPIRSGDAWIAATALAYDAPLITHNPNDFENVPGLTVITEK